MIWLLGGYMWLFVHRPFEYWGFLALIQIERVYMVLMLGYWAAMAPKHWLPNRLHGALFGLFGVMLLSWACSPFMGLLGETVEQYAKLVLFYILLVTSVRDEKGLRCLVGMYLGVVSLYMGHSLLEFMNGRHQWRQGISRMIGVDITYGDPNGFASCLACSLPMLVPFWACRPSRLLKLLLVGYALCTCVCVVLTGSRGGMVGLGVSCLLSLLALGWRLGAVGLLGGGAALGALIMPGSLQNRFLTLIDPSLGPPVAQDSAMGRLKGLINGFELFQQSPLLGYGPGGYPLATGEGMGAHNLYGQVLGELGFLGVLAFAGILYGFARNVLEARRRTPLGRPNDFPRQVAHVAGLSVVVLCVVGCGGHNLFRHFWLWFAAFQILALHCLRTRAAAAAACRRRLPYLLEPLPLLSRQPVAPPGVATTSAGDLSPGGWVNLPERVRERECMEKQAFVKHAAVYGLANLLVQAAGFLLVPVYTRCMSKADFGALEVVGRIAETVGTVLLFGGLRQALMTFYQDARDDGSRRRFIGSALFLVLGACLLGGIFLPLAGPLCTALGGDANAIGPGLVRLAVVGILLEPLALIPLTLFQARLRSGTFLGITAGQVLVRVSLVSAFVAGFGWGAWGVLAATALTAALSGGFLTGRELVRNAAWPDGTTVRGLLVFALPFLPGGVCFFVLHHGDRFFLLHWWGGEEVGVYALGYKLALAVSTFSLGPLYMVWSAHLYTVARTAEAPVVFGRAFTRLLAVCILAGLGLCLFQDEAVALLGGSNYAAASAVVPPVLLACLFQCGASLMDAGFYVRRRTDLKLGVTLAATAVMLTLYVLLIPGHGGLGTAFATLGGFSFLGVGTYVLTQRVFPVRYEWPRVAAMVGLAAGLWLFSRLLPAGLPWLAARAALWLAWPLLLWCTGMVTASEQQHLVALTRQVLGPTLGRLLALVRRLRPAPEGS